MGALGRLPPACARPRLRRSPEPRGGPAQSPGGGQQEAAWTLPARRVRSPGSPPALGLGRELRVAGRREPSSQVLEDVEGQTADQGDDGHFPQEGQRGDEVHVCGQTEHSGGRG